MENPIWENLYVYNLIYLLKKKHYHQMFHNGEISYHFGCQHLPHHLSLICLIYFKKCIHCRRAEMQALYSDYKWN